MIEKRITNPDELARLVPHWPEINPDKLKRITTRSSRDVSIRDSRNGSHHRGVVLAVPPIITCPSQTVDGARYILNGKHRAVLGVVAGYNLVEVVVEVRNDIRHRLSSLWKGDLSISDLEESFDNRAMYEGICMKQGVVTIEDLIRVQHRVLLEIFVDVARGEWRF